MLQQLETYINTDNDMDPDQTFWWWIRRVWRSILSHLIDNLLKEENIERINIQLINPRFTNNAGAFLRLILNGQLCDYFSLSRLLILQAVLFNFLSLLRQTYSLTSLGFRLSLGGLAMCLAAVNHNLSLSSRIIASILIVSFIAYLTG